MRVRDLISDILPNAHPSFEVRIIWEENWKVSYRGRLIFIPDYLLDRFIWEINISDEVLVIVIV